MPRISVVTVVLNAADHIGKALESVANQTCEDRECFLYHILAASIPRI